MEEFEQREALILSGQVPDGEIVKWMREIPGFGRWYNARALERARRGANHASTNSAGTS